MGQAAPSQVQLEQCRTCCRTAIQMVARLSTMDRPAASRPLVLGHLWQPGEELPSRFRPGSRWHRGSSLASARGRLFQHPAKAEDRVFGVLCLALGRSIPSLQNVLPPQMPSPMTAASSSRGTHRRQSLRTQGRRPSRPGAGRGEVRQVGAATRPWWAGITLALTFLDTANASSATRRASSARQGASDAVIPTKAARTITSWASKARACSTPFFIGAGTSLPV
jgi:hypothetical protein